MSDSISGCRCGSGGHPRKCDVHIGAFESHCARLDLDAYVDDLGLSEAQTKGLFERIDAYLKAEAAVVTKV